MLHVLAQGGAIRFDRLPSGKIRDIRCMTREGHLLSDCDMRVFDRLLKRRFIRSVGGRPYRVTRAGLAAVHAQPDNR